MASEAALNGHMARIARKPLVSFDGLAPVMFHALFIASEAYRSAGIGDVVVTSTTGGKHKEGSLHYRGRAVDLRLPPRERLDHVVSYMKRYLYGFDVVVEATHIHIEFDPK